MVDGITDSMDVDLGEFWKLVMDREAWCTVVHVVTKTVTELIFTKHFYIYLKCT